MMASRGMGAILKDKVPKPRIVKKRDGDLPVEIHAEGGEVWDRRRPKGLGKPKKLSSANKSKAKAAAKAAGRPYPNLVDNMRAAKMTTTGSTLFNMEFQEIAEEAWERAGREMRSGYDLRTARRSMNLLTIEWANRGINMWTIEQGSFNLTGGLNTYALPIDTIDLLEHVIRTNANQQNLQTDLNITRISASTYATIPNKLTQARPIQVLIQRLSGQTGPAGATLVGNLTSTETTITLSDTGNLAATGFIRIGSEDIYYGWISGNVLGGIFRGQNSTTAASHTNGDTVYMPQLPAITVWPTPDGSQTYTFAYWKLRRVQDAGNGIQTADMNFRFYPCLVAGLAYYIAMKMPDLVSRIDMLKGVYDEQFNLAAGEDREKASLRLVPRAQFIGGSAY